MTIAEVLPGITFDDYLHLEIDSDQRHEWVGGQVYVMTGRTERHDLLSALIYEALRPRHAPEDAGCSTSARSSWARSPTTRTCWWPAGKAPRRTGCTSAICPWWWRCCRPPPSASTGPRRRWPTRGAPSFEVYVLADSRRRRIEVAVRDGEDPTGGRRPVALRWSAHTGGSVPHLDTTVEDLHDQLDATALTD